MPSQHYDVSYVIKVANPNGASTMTSATDSVGRTNSTSSWDWAANCDPTYCYTLTGGATNTPPTAAFGAWIAPIGSASDLHIHNIKYDLNRSLALSTTSNYVDVFTINSGDSPRATMTWNGNLSVTPSVYNVPGGPMMGYTGNTSNVSGVYVGDDWTNASSPVAGRGNSIRFISYVGNTSQLAYPPVTITTLPNAYDTPIWDLHASGDNELWFVNYDEATTLNGPAVRLSTVQKLSRTSPAVQFGSTTTQYYSAQSSWRNNRYIAADRYGKIPTNMKYIYVFAIGSTGQGTGQTTVITRILR